jgi:hypothetical protein
MKGSIGIGAAVTIIVIVILALVLGVGVLALTSPGLHLFHRGIPFHLFHFLRKLI